VKNAFFKVKKVKNAFFKVKNAFFKVVFHLAKTRERERGRERIVCE